MYLKLLIYDILLCLCSRNSATYSNGIQLLSRTQSSGLSSAMAGHWWFSSHHVKYIQMLYVSSLCWQWLAVEHLCWKHTYSKPFAAASNPKWASIGVQNINPRPLFHLSITEGAYVTASAFDLCVLYYRSLCPYSSLSSKTSGKAGEFKSTYILVRD